MPEGVRLTLVITSRSGGAARRGHRTPASRRFLQLGLGAAAALSVAAAFGPVWVARGGVLVALLAGLGVLLVARGRLRDERQDYAERSARMTALRASAQERLERQHVAAVGRIRHDLQRAARTEVEAARREGDRAQQTAHRLRIELAGVIEERSALTAEVARLTTAAEERALAELPAPGTTGLEDGADRPALADVHRLPRHGIAATAEFTSAGPGWDNLEVDCARG